MTDDDFQDPTKRIPIFYREVGTECGREPSMEPPRFLHITDHTTEGDDEQDQGDTRGSSGFSY